MLDFLISHGEWGETLPDSADLTAIKAEKNGNELNHCRWVEAKTRAAAAGWLIFCVCVCVYSL